MNNIWLEKGQTEVIAKGWTFGGTGALEFEEFEESVHRKVAMLRWQFFAKLLFQRFQNFVIKNLFLRLQ